MALQIKKGVTLFPYGQNTNTKPLTSDSGLSQAVLEHLKESYPDDIEDTETPTKQAPKTKTK